MSNQYHKNQNHIKTKTQNQNFKTSFGFGACLAIPKKSRTGILFFSRYLFINNVKLKKFPAILYFFGVENYFSGIIQTRFDSK
jgi:hypothetical protein